MEHAVSIDTTWTRRLDALKTNNVSAPDNQQPLGDHDLDKFMDFKLYEATKTGDADTFIDALESVSGSRSLTLSLIFEQVTPSGNSLLHVAAKSENIDVMELILIHFPHLETRKNSMEDAPLHVAVQEGTVKAAEKLIDLGKDSETIFWKNKDGKSPLYLAAEIRRLEILKLLVVAYRQDHAYAVKTQGMSPVLAALEVKESGILKDIINRLPKLLHVKGEDGGTPLHYAASVGNVEAVRFLVDECSYLALQIDRNGSYPIHIACERGHVDIIHKLVQVWPDLAEIKNKEGENILHVAAKAGNNKVVRHILEECCKPNVKKLVNSKDVHGNTPLHLASMHNHCTVMLYLTGEEGAHLEQLNNDKLTALDVALEDGGLSMTYPALLGRGILITAGVPRNKGRGIRSPGEQSTKGRESRAKSVRERVNTRLLVATLVATVTFAAGFTLPGGYNASSDPHPGMATMLHHGVFQLFIISNTLAMYSSIHAVVVLLWGHVTDFSIARLASSTAGPILLLALTSMSVAFMAAVVLAVSKLTWLAIVVLCIAGFYLLMLMMVLAPLIFPFSKTAMRFGSLYYQLVAQPVLDALGIWRFSRGIRVTLRRNIPNWMSSII